MDHSDELMKRMVVHADAKPEIVVSTPGQRAVRLISTLCDGAKQSEDRTYYLYCATEVEENIIAAGFKDGGIIIDACDEKLVASLPDSIEETVWRGYWFGEKETKPWFFPQGKQGKTIIVKNFEQAPDRAIWAILYMGNPGGVRINDELIVAHDKLPLGNCILIMSNKPIGEMAPICDRIYPQWRGQLQSALTYDRLAYH